MLDPVDNMQCSSDFDSLEKGNDDVLDLYNYLKGKLGNFHNEAYTGFIVSLAPNELDTHSFNELNSFILSELSEVCVLHPRWRVCFRF